MISAMDNRLQMPINEPKLPQLKTVKNEAEIIKTAHDFTSVFFSEYVGIMLDEAKDEDDDFGFEVARTLQSQALGEQLANTDTGRRMTDQLIGEITKMQIKAEERFHGRA
jgi:hypothetical protein